MDVVTCVDMVIGISMLVSILVGYHRGFLVTIARIVAMVASYIGAVLIAGALKESIADTVILPAVQQQMEGSSLTGLAGEALTGAAQGIAYSIVFFAAFAIIHFILLRLVHGLKLVDHIPVLGTMNKLAGGILGFLWIFILCMLLGNIFFNYIPSQVRSQWGFTQEAVQNSMLLNAFEP